MSFMTFMGFMGLMRRALYVAMGFWIGVSLCGESL